MQRHAVTNTCALIAGCFMEVTRGWWPRCWHLVMWGWHGDLDILSNLTFVHHLTSPDPHSPSLARSLKYKNKRVYQKYILGSRRMIHANRLASRRPIKHFTNLSEKFNTFHKFSKRPLVLTDYISKHSPQSPAWWRAGRTRCQGSEGWHPPPRRWSRTQGCCSRARCSHMTLAQRTCAGGNNRQNPVSIITWRGLWLPLL